MTEKQWLKCTSPGPMLELLQGKASERQLRLFARACLQRVRDLLVQEESLAALEALQQRADGRMEQAAFRDAWCAAAQVRLIRKTRKKDYSPEKSAAWAAMVALGPEAFPAARSCSGILDGLARAPGGNEDRRQCADIRDVFGNPFRRVPFSASWRSPAVVVVAQAAYEERLQPGDVLDNARLAILADALEEAGCTEQAILEHLRGPGQHVPGCWALDQALGRE
jgi:hypothetical protein